ncbi:MAG: hypothetical protein LUF28_00545 [Clostridiales bacterium]|nr:hypothetical protein [Clostridiales bacterium]
MAAFEIPLLSAPFFCIVSPWAALKMTMCALFCLLMVYLLSSAAERYVPMPEPPTERA